MNATTLFAFFINGVECHRTRGSYAWVTAQAEAYNAAYPSHPVTVQPVAR